MKLNIEKHFNEQNILKVVNILEDYLPVLFAQEPNIEISQKISAIEEDIEELKSTEISALFMEYEELAYCDTIQRNWLAYYIGFKKGYIKGKNSDSSID